MSQTTANTPRKRDRRIERTHQLLNKALMDLIVERGYESITIQDITDRANVSRTTFYLHFKDKDELLFTSMQAIYDDLVSDQAITMPLDVDPSELSDLDCDTRDFEHVAEFADFYRVMLSNKGSPGFIPRVLTYLTDVVTPALEAQLEGQEPPMPLSLIAAYCAGAEVSIMKWWLENDMPYTPQEMARMTFQLTAYGLNAALGGDDA